MTEKQQNQLAVQKAVMDVMEKNITKWQSIAELKSKYDLFVWNIKKIDGYKVILQTDLASLKEKKTNTRKELTEQAFPVTSVLGVFMYDMGDKKLGKFINMKYSELEKMNPDVLERYCIKVLKISRALMDQNVEAEKKAPKHVIGDYGLTAKHLDTLQIALDQYIREEAVFSETRLSKKKSKSKLNRRIRENNVLLKKKIDRMMHLFRDSQKTFYKAYIKSRIPAESEPA
ncbi:MAG: hypothetical protein KAR19_14200 [Bacteroidales bacterium]|nr:hypothetical protein [Bacteroidales bacterium]